MKKNLLFLFSLAVLFSFWSCQQFSGFDEIDEVVYEAEYAIPLVNTRLSVRDVLKEFEENSTLIVDPGGLIHLNYTGDVISQTSEDIFAEINEQLPPLIPIITDSMPLVFSSPDGLEIDQIIFGGGNLFYQFQSREPVPLAVTIRAPQLEKDGEPLTIRTNAAAYSGSGPPVVLTNGFSPLSLEDYVLTTDNGRIDILYEAATPDGQTVTLPNFIMAFRDLTFRYAEGYLGTTVFEGGRDTIGIDFFEDWIEGDVFFNEPRITYSFENAFGLPTRSIINVLKVLTVDGKVIELESDVIGPGVGIDFAYPTLEEVGQAKTTVFTFDKDNSNITTLVENGPIAIDYDIDVLAHPDMDRSIRGFITDSSFYRVSVEVDLPLYGTAANFIARDTIDLDFTNWQDVDAAEYKLVAENGLPLEVIIQGYFLSPGGVVLDSLLAAPQRVIAGAPVDAQGEVTAPVTEITFAPFSADRFSAVKSSDRIVVVAEFATTNNGDVPVRVYSDQEVKVRVGAKMTFSN